MSTAWKHNIFKTLARKIQSRRRLTTAQRVRWQDVIADFNRHYVQSEGRAGITNEEALRLHAMLKRVGKRPRATKRKRSFGKRKRRYA